MKTVASIAFLAALVAWVPSASADSKWDLRKETSSSVCHVQQSDSRPLLGNLIKTFATRREACAEAKAQFDNSLSNPSKCWTYGNSTKTNCKNDGVNL